MGIIDGSVERPTARLSNEASSERYLGRLYRLHPERAPKSGVPPVIVDVPEIVHLPTHRTIDDATNRMIFIPQEIMKTVAEFYGASHQEIVGPSRFGNIVRARQVAMYLCHKLVRISLSDIGRRFDRDHTTVLHAVRRINQKILKDARLCDEIDILKLKLIDITEDKPE